MTFRNNNNNNYYYYYYYYYVYLEFPRLKFKWVSYMITIAH